VEELVYPSLAAALLTAALVLLLAGRWDDSDERSAVEYFIRELGAILPPFLEAMPQWAREAPVIFGGIALSIVTVGCWRAPCQLWRFNLLAVAMACAVVLVARRRVYRQVSRTGRSSCYLISDGLRGRLQPKPYETRSSRIAPPRRVA